MNFQITHQELIALVKMYRQKIGSNTGNQILYIQKKGGIRYLLHALYTHPNKGIRKLSVDERILQFGSNKKQIREQTSFLFFFFQALNDFILKILMIAAILSIIIETATASPKDRSTAWIQGFSIFFAVLVCSFVTALNDFQKQKQFQKLNQITETRKMVNVIRESQLLTINQNLIVTGDIINIREGMQIPVDGWLLQSSQIYVDQSSMTGQSQPVHKNTIEYCHNFLKNQNIPHNKINVPSPILLSGTKVYSGQGKMLCLLVGKNSSLGQISNLIELKKQQLTPLQEKLQKLAQDIGKFGLYSSLTILLALLIRFTIQRVHQGIWITSTHLAQLLNFFLLAITVIVVAIPQGLPLAVTLTLAYSVKKMLMDNNLVRRMQACQTMGGANIICSDKTGTLTMNKMSVHSWWNQKTTQVSTHTEIALDYPNMNNAFRQLLLINIFVNSSAQLRPEVNGSSTQIALMAFGQRFQQKYQIYRTKYNLLQKFPFNSTRKRMTIITEVKNKLHLFIKGASQIILNDCNELYKNTTGQIIKIDKKLKKEILSSIEQMAEKGLRTIVLAYKQLDKMQNFIKSNDGLYDVQKHSLILLSIIGVRDLPRIQVPQAILQCKRAGIKVKMVTGDNLITATAIAKQIGIIVQNQPSLCMQGPQFNRIIGGIICDNCKTEKCQCSTDLNQKNKPIRKDIIKNQQQFARIVKHLDVLARSRPQDKYALVTGLINLGNVVAVTGDGTNDAPALRKADVGFAMGKTGTQVARQASSIVLLDDNFNSIVKSVIWGRNIYDSIKKFIQFQLTVNIVAVFITLVGAVVLNQSILTPIQMLWVNMIMDSLASLALATQSPTEQLLDRLPYKRDQYLITKKMWKNIGFQALYQITVLIVLIFWGQNFITQQPDKFDIELNGHLQYKYNNGIVQNGHVVSGRLYFLFTNKPSYQLIFEQYGMYSRHFTVIFNTFVFLQIFNFFNCRKLKDQFNILERIRQNYLFVIVLLVIIFLQIILVTFGSIAFGLYSYYGLNRDQWIISVGLGMGSLIVSVISKLFPEQKWCIFDVEQAIQSQIKFRQNKSYKLALKKKIYVNPPEQISQSEKILKK